MPFPLSVCVVQVCYPFSLLFSHLYPGPPGWTRISLDNPQWLVQWWAQDLIIQGNETKPWVLFFCWTHWRRETLFCEVTWMIEYVSNRKKMRAMQRKKIQEMDKVRWLMNKFEYVNPLKCELPLEILVTWTINPPQHSHPPHPPNIFCWISAICNRKFYWIELTDFEFIPSASIISLFVFWDDSHSNTHPTSKLFSLLHFPRIAVNQEALGVAEAGHHGLLQELQNDALEQRESGQDPDSSTEQHSGVTKGLPAIPSWQGGETY